MRSSTLFGIYAVVVVALVGGLTANTIYSLRKSQWWEERTRIANESYALHLQLEVNVYQLFKQHGDALLIGDRDGGEGEAALQDKIAQNLSDIRTAIAREIQIVGDQEIEELAHLDEIEADIASINAAIATMTADGDPIDALLQVERLAALLDSDIDVKLASKISAALDDERAEVDGAFAAAAAFRKSNAQLVYTLLGVTIVLLALGLHSFNAQMRRPLLRLQQRLDRLRTGDYGPPTTLGGSREFQELGAMLNAMGRALADREASREDRQRELEATVASRTAELHSLVRRLETGEANRKRLMADISHELRTPLAIILGEADVTLRTAEDMGSDVSDSLARIRDAARHTNQIVDDLLTVARQEAGQLRLDRKEADLRRIVRDAARLFPFPVTLDLPDDPAPAAVDEVRLRQSLLALLQNARRYGGQSITVTLRQDAASLSVAVLDDGPGLGAAEKAQAFERFFRGSNGSGPGTEGSGLGLPIVKSIVEAHGGRVELQDGPDGGLCVVITLPHEQRLKVVASSELPPAAGRRRRT
jgi:two-component system OmpR family sensor kinase